MTVYRYMHIGDVDFLPELILGNRLRFKGRKEFLLADQYDCLARLAWPPAEEEFRAGLDESLRRTEKNLSAAERLTRIEQEIREIPWRTAEYCETMERRAQELVDTCGILCASETPTSLRHWDEFAGGGTGICLQLSSEGLRDQLRLPPGEFTKSRLPVAVSYVDEAGEPSSSARALELVNHFFLKKKPSFRWQQERRVVVPELLKDGKTYEDVEFEAAVLQRVILGYAMSTEREARIRELAAQRVPGLLVSRAKLTSGVVVVEA